MNAIRGGAVREGHYVAENGYRWVLGVLRDRVVYSKGGEHHYSCKIATMKRWINRVKAKRVADEGPA